MAITNCPICGTLHVPNKRGMCSHCAELEDQRFEVVKLYLEENPDANIDAIALDTGIDQTVVLRFIRSGRLVARPHAGLTCERCGKAIETGVVCRSCAREMTDEIRLLTGGGRESRMHVHQRKVDRR